MARGFGAKAARTGKCKCVSPNWQTFELRTTAAGELVITLECKSCKALWDSKARDFRKYVRLDGTAYFSNSTKQVTTYQDIMRHADRIRQDCLQRQIRDQLVIIEAAQKELKKAQAELEFLENAPLVP